MGNNLQNAFVALGTTLFPEVVNFYRAFLALEPAIYQKNRYAEFCLPALKLGIFSPQSDQFAEFANSPGSGLSLCLEVESLERAIATLNTINYEGEIQIRTSSHGREIYIYDPAHNRLILHQSFHPITDSPPD